MLDKKERVNSQSEDKLAEREKFSGLAEREKFSGRTPRRPPEGGENTTEILAKLPKATRQGMESPMGFLAPSPEKPLRMRTASRWAEPVQ